MYPFIVVHPFVHNHMITSSLHKYNIRYKQMTNPKMGKTMNLVVEPTNENPTLCVCVCVVWRHNHKIKCNDDNVPDNSSCSNKTEESSISKDNDISPYTVTRIEPFVANLTLAQFSLSTIILMQSSLNYLTTTDKNDHTQWNQLNCICQCIFCWLRKSMSNMLALYWHHI